MKDYNKKIEEIKNRKLLFNNWIMLIGSLIFYFAFVFITAFTIKDEFIVDLIIIPATILIVVVCWFGYKSDIDIGYYECKKCHHKFVPTYKEALFVMHLPTKRHLKCPKCNKRTWAKKVMSK